MSFLLGQQFPQLGRTSDQHSKRTPGPWKVLKPQCSGRLEPPTLWIVPAAMTSETIAEVFGQGPEANAANAHFIVELERENRELREAAWWLLCQAQVVLDNRNDPTKIEGLKEGCRRVRAALEEET